MIPAAFFRLANCFLSFKAAVFRSLQLRCFLLRALPHDKMNGGSPEIEGFPDLIFNITRIRKMHQLLVIYENDEGRRADGHLRNIEQLQTPSLIRRRRIESDRLGKNLVEDSCRNSAVLVRKNHINRIEKLRQALPVSAEMKRISA